VGLLVQLLGVPDRRTAGSVLGRARADSGALIHRVTGDEQVPPGPVTQGIHRLPHVPGDVAADVDDRIPAATTQRRIVARVAVA
jgi:hypothetical protein